MVTTNLVWLCVGLHVMSPAEGVSIYGHDSANNLVANYGFEDDMTDWVACVKSVCSISSDAHTGSKSLNVTDRTHHSGGPFAKVVESKSDLAENKTYYGSVFFKMTELPAGLASTEFKLIARNTYENPDGSKTKEKITIAKFTRARPAPYFRQIGGDFYIKPDIHRTDLVIRNDDLGVNYLVDDYALTEIPEDPDWRTKAQADIDVIRKGNVSLSGTIPPRVPYCKVGFRVTQVKENFTWSSTISANMFNEPTNTTYRNFIANNFNGAGPGNEEKWRLMEKVQGVLITERIYTMMDYLDELGIDSTRYHWTLNGIKENNPDWVQNLTGQALKDVIDSRISQVMANFSSRVVEFDVLNEHTSANGGWLEDATGDPDIVCTVFNRSRQLAPGVSHITNDYSGVNRGLFTSAIIDMMKYLDHLGCPSSGVGVQSHLNDPVKPEILRQRLAIIAAGLESNEHITVSEVTVHDTDEQGRRDGLDQAIHIYFAQPKVKTINLWFWSNESKIQASGNTDNYLFVGPNFEPTVAGQHYLNLRQNWRTNFNFTATDFAVSKTSTAFYGEYRVETLYDDQSVKNQTFTIEPEDGDVQWTLDMADGDFPSVIPPEDYDACGLSPPN